MTRTPLVPDETHPITIEPAGTRVRVLAGDRVIADTTNALALREASYPVTYYLPREDVAAEVLRPSGTATYCPYKGDASYVDVVTDSGTIPDAAWSYVDAYPSVAPIANHLAWYPDKVTIVVD
ncbi:DUF427 domain-containing protein [Millisia brevis]|uniref:DUF427 domain-containing protein n=1 Tax=Millisia brevis TaxID=264148 RepID=UPI0008361784|nr:DUF427 domain-containing protein [Millisia brevis]